MGNSLGFYDPQFYASEALLVLMKALGLANTVYRGYDATPQQKGSTINISGPGVFTATDVNTTTGGNTQDVKARDVTITLNKWMESKFTLTDKDLTFTKAKIITDHIMPAAYSLADAIDQDLATQIKLIPWFDNWSSTVVASDALKARKRLFDNKAPMSDGQLYFMLDSAKEADLLGLEAFGQYQGAGDVGVNTQVNGYLGKRYGMNFFANQNTPALTSGTASDLAGAIDLEAGYSAGVTTIHVDALTDGSTFKAGDVITIAGDSQWYVITEDVALSGVTEADFKIYPALQKDVINDVVVTIKLAAGSGATKNQCFAYHRNCIALAMAPLSDMGNNLGARIGVAVDPVTGLALRSRIWYDADHSSVKVGIDALWGKAVLDPALGCRML